MQSIQYAQNSVKTLEYKFQKIDTILPSDSETMIEGYASLFHHPDQGRDIVMPGAYSKSLKKSAKAQKKVPMLWQHDPTQPIGVWDSVIEDNHGLYVKGRLLHEVAKGKEAAILIKNHVIDGLSIGYQTHRSRKSSEGFRLLLELDLWEISLVTFPMLSLATLTGKTAGDTMQDLITDLNRACHCVG